MIGINGLLDGYYFGWCPIYPSHGTFNNPCQKHGETYAKTGDSLHGKNWRNTKERERRESTSLITLSRSQSTREQRRHLVDTGKHWRTWWHGFAQNLKIHHCMLGFWKRLLEELYKPRLTWESLPIHMVYHPIQNQNSQLNRFHSLSTHHLG